MQQVFNIFSNKYTPIPGSNTQGLLKCKVSPHLFPIRVSISHSEKANKWTKHQLYHFQICSTKFINLKLSYLTFRGKLFQIVGEPSVTARAVVVRIMHRIVWSWGWALSIPVDSCQLFHIQATSKQPSKLILWPVVVTTKKLIIKLLRFSWPLQNCNTINVQKVKFNW